MTNVDEILEAHPELEKATPFYEANVFAMHPVGFKVHYKVLARPAVVIRSMEQLISALVESGYVPEQSYAAPPQKAQNGQHAPEPLPVTAVGVMRCPNGHTEFYDNRSTKKGNQPDYRCKTCEYGGWIKDDGEINWLPPKS